MVWLIKATAPPSPGQGLTWIGWPSTSPIVRIRAPPEVVNQVRFHAGADTAPATGRPSWIRPMLTVQCSSPRTKALVPSSGSTRKKRGPIWSGVPNSEASSSETTGTPGKRRASSCRISASPRRSASVTGLSSALRSTCSPERHSGRISRPAASTMSASTRPSSASALMFNIPPAARADPARRTPRSPCWCRWSACRRPRN